MVNLKTVQSTTAMVVCQFLERVLHDSTGSCTFKVQILQATELGTLLSARKSLWLICLNEKMESGNQRTEYVRLCREGGRLCRSTVTVPGSACKRLLPEWRSTRTTKGNYLACRAILGVCQEREYAAT